MHSQSHTSEAMRSILNTSADAFSAYVVDTRMRNTSAGAKIQVFLSWFVSILWMCELDSGYFYLSTSMVIYTSLFAMQISLWLYCLKFYTT